MQINLSFRAASIVGAAAGLFINIGVAPAQAQGQPQSASTAVNLPPIRLSTDALSTTGSTITAAGDTGGVRVAFSNAEWPSVAFNAGRAYLEKDWSRYGGVAFTVHNPNATPLHLFIRVDDDPSANGVDHCRTGNVILAPDETATLAFPLSAMALGKMRAGPLQLSTADKPRMLTIYGPPLNEKNIVGFQIFLSQPKQSQNLDLRGVRFLPKPNLVGIVDKFGQYARADWPGKVHDEEDIAKNRESEKAWLAAHPPFADRDEYGGWQSGLTLKATGFFRTALVQSAGNKEVTPPPPGSALPEGTRWWLVTPTGHLFWSAGADCIRPYAEGNIEDIEQLFTFLTDDWKNRKLTDFYLAAVQRKYGEKWQSAWIDSNVARIKAWGFNTAGNWSDTELWRLHRVPYTVPLFVGGLPPIAAKPGSGMGLQDYFDEKFPELARAACLDQTKEWKSDPWCLGYFMDNELAWDSWAQMGTGGAYVVAREVIAAPTTLAARRAFMKILKAKYPTATDWGKAWSVTVSDWDAPVTIEASALNEAARADCAAFSTALAERYFSTMRAAIKAAAPSQLYLGCRFAIRPKEMVDVAARYCDVVSFNIYEDTIDPQTWAFTNRLGKPVLIGEFHFGATDRGMFHPGLKARANQAERANAYATYVQSARDMPAFVGSHWFQWVDEPLTGRFDGENYNIGFITVTDTPYPEMVEAARRVHATLYTPPAKKQAVQRRVPRKP